MSPLSSHNAAPDELDPYDAANQDPVTYWAFNFFAASVALSILMAVWAAIDLAVL